jgi:hypothetical protein
VASRADEYRERAAQCAAKSVSAPDSKTKENFTALVKRWRELARQLDMLEEDY